MNYPVSVTGLVVQVIALYEHFLPIKEKQLRNFISSNWPIIVRGSS